MTTRIASCSRGQLRAVCEGEAVRVSLCHCLECQKRTGGLFGVADDEAGSRMFFAECASLTNPKVEYEWYLAKGEVAAASRM